MFWGERLAIFYFSLLHTIDLQLTFLKSLALRRCAETAFPLNEMSVVVKEFDHYRV